MEGHQKSQMLRQQHTWGEGEASELGWSEEEEAKGQPNNSQQLCEELLQGQQNQTLVGSARLPSRGQWSQIVGQRLRTGHWKNSSPGGKCWLEEVIQRG